REAVRPRQRHSRLLHDPARADIVLISRGDHAPYSELGETLPNQRPRSFGAEALAPGRFPQPVAQLDLVGASAFRRPEVEPPQKFTGLLFDGCPEAEAVELLVVTEDAR